MYILYIAICIRSWTGIRNMSIHGIKMSYIRHFVLLDIVTCMRSWAVIPLSAENLVMFSSMLSSPSGFSPVSSSAPTHTSKETFHMAKEPGHMVK